MPVGRPPALRAGSCSASWDVDRPGLISAVSAVGESPGAARKTPATGTGHGPLSSGFFGIIWSPIPEAVPGGTAPERTG